MALKLRKNRSQTPICPIDQCMSYIGGAWTPNILWYLSGGARRFSELRIDLPTITAKVLTARLRTLEDKGVVKRTQVDSSPPSVEYSLTVQGKEFIPAIEAIMQVGEKLKRGKRQST